MYQRIKPVVMIGTAVAILASAGWALAQDSHTEHTVQNLSLIHI